MGHWIVQKGDTDEYGRVRELLPYMVTTKSTEGLETWGGRRVCRCPSSCWISLRRESHASPPCSRISSTCIRNISGDSSRRAVAVRDGVWRPASAGATEQRSSAGERVKPVRALWLCPGEWLYLLLGIPYGFRMVFIAWGKLPSSTIDISSPGIETLI